MPASSPGYYRNLDDFPADFPLIQSPAGPRKHGPKAFLLQYGHLVRHATPLKTIMIRDVSVWGPATSGGQRGTARWKDRTLGVTPFPSTPGAETPTMRNA